MVSFLFLLSGSSLAQPSHSKSVSRSSSSSRGQSMRGGHRAVMRKSARKQLFEDRQGNIWEITRNGKVLVQRASRRFRSSWDEPSWDEPAWRRSSWPQPRFVSEGDVALAELEHGTKRFAMQQKTEQSKGTVKAFVSDVRGLGETLLRETGDLLNNTVNVVGGILGAFFG